MSGDEVRGKSSPTGAPSSFGSAEGMLRLSEVLKPPWSRPLLMSGGGSPERTSSSSSEVSVTRPTHTSAALAVSPDGRSMAEDDEDLSARIARNKGRGDDAVLTPEGFIRTIEWDMMDKRKFFPLSMASSFTVRCFLYPLTLVRTRLQVQHRADMYHGTWDAFRKIVQAEGVRGLYRGFWVSAFQVVSGICYVSTYEGVRLAMETNGITNSSAKAFVGGGIASVVGQTIIVPFDVISQHLMIIGQLSAKNSTVEGAKDPKSSYNSRLNPLGVQVEGRSKGQIAADITRAVYRRDGLKGFYRG